MESSSAQLIDEYEHDNEFIFYSPTNIPGKGCDADLFNSQISTCCSCSGGCSSIITCECLSNNDEINYLHKRLVESKLNPGAGKSGYIIECGGQCECNISKCENRVIQFGPTTGMKIKHFAAKGYGLITTKPLHKGEFICEYAGEVISEEEATNRYVGDNINYIFTLNEFVGNQRMKTIVDATCIGNVGRYINHSCSPNCIVVPVRVDSIIPRLCIFARKDIAINEEITYKYGDASNAICENNFGKLKVCHCGFDKCTKYLPCGL